jgi:hypothetical protein
MTHGMAELLGGMLIMTGLAFCVCVGIAILAYRKRNRSGAD